MTCSTVDGSAVCESPTGVVAVSVFNWMDGIAAALVDMAVVTIDTAVVKVFGAGLDNAVIWKNTAIGTVATEAETCICEREYWFGKCAVVYPSTVVAVTFGTAGVGTGIVGAVVGDVTGVAGIGHGSTEDSAGILVAVTAIGAGADA